MIVFLTPHVLIDARCSKAANELFYEILPEAKQQKNESDEEENDTETQTPAYYEAKYEPMFRSLIKQLKAYTEIEVKKAEAKIGQDPLPVALSQNVPSRRYARCVSMTMARSSQTLLSRRGKAKGNTDQVEYVSEVKQLLDYLNQRENGIWELSRNFGVRHSSLCTTAWARPILSLYSRSK